MENFHEIFEKRKEIKKAVSELGLERSGETAGESDVSDEAVKATEVADKSPKTPEKSSKQRIFERHYKKEKSALDAKAAGFKVADFRKDKTSGTEKEETLGVSDSGLSGAKEALKKQKIEYENQSTKEWNDNRAQIDYEAIKSEAPEIEAALRIEKDIADLKDFRMRRMLQVLNPQTSLTVRKTIQPILETVHEEIIANEEKLEKTDPIVRRQAELIGYKEDLSKSGHICITPSVEKNLQAIGERMLTGKAMFLHGPTGTGKTSLARLAASHFTGKDPEMIYCNPQTKESNVWGKTGIRPSKAGHGAIETVEIFGPLAKAADEGRAVIFDEFTALPKEQQVFIKGILNARPGDKINITGNGIIEIRPGFQMVFTANLKSEKNPERQDLPPEIAREFEQNNLKVNYTPPEEAYDVMIARLQNSDGSLDMSFYDLNTTLPNLCKVMADIQESYTNKTDDEVARRAGAMNAGGKVYSLKKFVMTQGSIESILSSWLVEKQMQGGARSFSEFLDDRFRTALTFDEYPKEDRILVAKILASRGFLLTLEAKDIGLPEDIFTLNTIKAMRGEEAVEELKKKSDDINHLTLKEVAELDPFLKMGERIRKQAEGLLNEEDKGGDEFSEAMRKRLSKIFGRESGEKESHVVSAEYTHTNPATHAIEHQETITLDIEKKTLEFLDFYKKTGIDLPPDFEETIKEIWERNYDEIQQAVEQQGFDEILILPANLPLPDLSEKMKMQNGYFTGSNFDAGGGFAGAVSPNVDKPRLILVHKTQNLKDRPELKATLNIKGQDVDLTKTLTLEDYLVFQRKYFEETNKHLDEDGWTWLSTKSGARLVNSGWRPGHGRLRVPANDHDYQHDNLGARPSRSFF